ncbi:hypothetical protein ACFVXC_14225 [Streptomyces sp. NPDC058257]
MADSDLKRRKVLVLGGGGAKDGWLMAVPPSDAPSGAPIDAPSKSKS